MQLMANGVDETLNVDYTIMRNHISGIQDNDTLTYDILNSQSIIVNFSGVFNSIITGITGGVNPTLNITGLSGVCYGNTNYPKFGFDVFLNGQKLISGYEYNVQSTGVSGFNVLVSGSEILNPDSTSIDNAELSFIPQFNNFIYLLSGVTQSISSFSGIVGFSEQVWVNGIRQSRGIDYGVVYPCSTQSGITNLSNLAYNFYNNNNNIWNFLYPVKPTGVTGVVFTPNGTTSGYLDMNLYWPNINTSVYGTGNYLQLQASINSGVSGVFYTGTNLNTAKFSISGTGHSQSVCAQLTYRNGNIVSESSPINCYNY